MYLHVVYTRHAEYSRRKRVCLSKWFMPNTHRRRDSTRQLSRRCVLGVTLFGFTVFSTVIVYMWHACQQEKSTLDKMDRPRFMSVSQGRWPPYSNCPYILVSEASLPDYEDEFSATYTSHRDTNKHCHVRQTHPITVPVCTATLSSALSRIGQWVMGTLLMSQMGHHF